MPYEVTADPTLIAYATADDALSVIDSRGGGAAFAELSSDEQDQQLAAASIDLDTSDWIGTRATTTQALEWPRTGTAYSDDAWPGVLVDATIELAFANAAKLAADANADVLNPSTNGNLKRKKVGPIEREWFAPTTTAAATDVTRWPTIVQALIARLIRTTTASWGSSASVVRSS